MKLPETIHESWHRYLLPLFESPAMDYLESEVLSKNICPTIDKVFKVFEMPLDKIRVVILGTEPNPSNHYATGLAYAVPTGQEPTFELSTIIDEIALTYSFDTTLKGGPDGIFQEDLNHWVDEGVFLLNMALTTIEGRQKAHTAVWVGFTNRVIEVIAEQCKDVIWLLWGTEAQAFRSTIKEHSQTNHHMLESNHPSEELQGKRFIGSKHFTTVNDILKEQERIFISWESEDELPF